jgi:hypothetical protein
MMMMAGRRKRESSRVVFRVDLPLYAVQPRSDTIWEPTPAVLAKGPEMDPQKDELTGQAGGGWVRAHLARARRRMRAARVLILPQGQAPTILKA